MATASIADSRNSLQSEQDACWAGLVAGIAETAARDPMAAVVLENNSMIIAIFTTAPDSSPVWGTPL